MKFWDTSAIVPLCIQDTGTATVRDILNEDPSFVIWWGTRTECAPRSCEGYEMAT